MNLPEKLDNTAAIKLWDELAMEKVRFPDLALNPNFFMFFQHEMGMVPQYILLYEKGEAAGLFPLVRDGSKFCSLPHLSYGGIYWMEGFKLRADHKGLVRQIIHTLLTEVSASGFYRYDFEDVNSLSGMLEVNVEIRGRIPFFGNTEAGKVAHYITLDSGYQDIAGSFSSNVNRKISRARKNGITVKCGGPELVPDFTRVYNCNIQRIGSPTLGERFFTSLAVQKDLNVEVFVAYLENKPVGGSFCMWYDGFYENTWFATLNQYNKYYTSYLLHAEMIKSAVEKNAQIYSLGRSTAGSGVQRYKLQWPVSEVPIYFSKTMIPGFSLKDQKWISKLWKYVPPIIADATGPYFAKKMY